MPTSDLKQPPIDRDVPAAIRAIGPAFGDAVRIEVPGAVPRLEVHVTWAGVRTEFAAEYRASGGTRGLDAATQQARRRAAQSGQQPMVIVPYLSEARVDRLLLEGVSGLDLCGNGLVVVPGKLLLRRDGRPNRYPESSPAKFAYRGATSLVPRVFLRRPAFRTANEVLAEIRAAGGRIVISTVSKALSRMADDLIIERDDDGIRLVQPDKLLAALARDFTTPPPIREARGKLLAPLAEVFERAATSGLDAPKPAGWPPLVLAGASSVARYAAGLRADAPTLYCRDLDALRLTLEGVWQPTERYADAVVVETSDPTPFFDARPDAQGIAYASPVQTYLELERGEKRDQELARQVREIVLREASGRPGAAQ